MVSRTITEIHRNIVFTMQTWINENIDKVIKIEDAAKRSGYSKRHLQRIFNKHVGITMARYIREKKLDLAARDLQLTNYSINDIAHKYGFEDQQAFTKAFSTHYNQPPARWRRNCKLHLNHIAAKCYTVGEATH